MVEDISDEFPSDNLGDDVEEKAGEHAELAQYVEAGAAIEDSGCT